MLPQGVVQAHLGKVHALHQRDRKEGFGEVWMPQALARKYRRAPLRMGVAVRVPCRHRSEDPEIRSLQELLGHADV